MSGMGYAQIGSSISSSASGTLGIKAASQTRVRMLKYNEKALYEQAELIELMGQYNARKIRSRGERFKASQRARVGVSGLRPESFEEALAHTEGQIKMDEELTLWQAAEERRRVRNQAKIAHWQARRDERQSKLAAWGKMFSMG